MSEAEEVMPEVKQIDLKVKLPNFISEEILQIPYSSEASLADLKQTLSAVPITRHLTNYNVFAQGTNLTEVVDELAPFSDIITDLNLDADNLQIEVRQKAYNLASVYEQVVRLRDTIGLHFIDRMSLDFGASAGVNKFNTIDLAKLEIKEPESSEEDKDVEKKEIEKEEDKDEENEKEKEQEQTQISDEDKAALNKVADEISSVDSSKLSDQVTFDTTNEKLKIPIKSLTISQWSPVPASQRVKGDLLYLTLQTLENESFNITCHFSGFFVNRCSTVNFNPEIKVNEKGKMNKSYLLYNLISSLSPSFEKVIEQNEAALTTSSEHPETYLLSNNAFLAYPWLVNNQKPQNHPDLSRSQLPLIANGVDGSDFIKEWNDDIQGIKDLQGNTVEERIMKEKLIHKTLHEFNRVATETAINIVKGNLTPMNPGEEVDKQIYLKNGIFYSSGSTAVDSFEATGGNEAARYTCSKDLSAIKILNKAHVQGVHNLVTSIVDYMGKRIVCQAPVPGIFNNSVEEEESEDKVVYGLSSDNTKIVQNKAFEEPLKVVAELFHLKPHSVKCAEDIKSDSDLIVSKDTKGIFGTDGRKYVIDMYRTVPLDIEFIEQNFDLSKDNSYPHGEASVRHEAVDSWWRKEIGNLIKAETEKLEKEGKKNDEKQKLNVKADDVTFNPDAFTCVDESKKDQDEVRSISKYIKDTLIEEYLDTIPHQIAPFDGQQLSSILHNYGINLRYLGYIAEQAVARREKFLRETEEAIKANVTESEKKAAERAAKEKEDAEKKKSEEESKEDKDEKKDENKDEEKQEDTKATYEPVFANFNALYRVSIQEMIARAVKHILRKLITNVPFYLVPSVVTHFHNCLFGGDINKKPEAQFDEELKLFYPESAFEFASLTHESVLKLIQKEVFVRFRYTLPESWISEIKSTQLLREIAVKFGIQWKAQDYAFSAEEFEANKAKFATQKQVIETTKSKKKGKKETSVQTQTVERNSIFVPEDIVNFVPKVKDSGYKASLIDEIFATARGHIAQGEKETGIAILNDLLNIQEQIYGRVHPETAKFYLSVSQVYSELGFELEAANIARKAIILSERTLGFDCSETINAYMNAGYYESANLQVVNSMKLYEQAIGTVASVYGSDHPAFITTLTNLADNLHRVKLFDGAIKLFEKALDLSIKINGEVSEVTGAIIHRLANLLVNVSKIKESLAMFIKASDIFTKLLGEDDFLSKEASKNAAGLTNYLEYLKYVEKQKKQEVAASTNGKGRVRSTQEITEAVKGGKKSTKHKKNQVLQADPSIASQSIDDIMKFIEGGDKKKKSQKKGGKK
jgi:protein TIF31